jgi:release factor glutamine methyltransferase
MTIAEALSRAAEQLRAAGIDSAQLDARVLLAHVMGVEPNELIVKGGDEVPAEFEKLIARRIAREPVAYITGKKGFWDLDFETGSGALVPRPETETLIEETQKQFPDKTAPLKILDLGTGTGCILLTLLHLYPNAGGIGVDSSGEALHWAGRNAARLDLESRCELRLCDWADISETGFGLIVSNPPYLTDADMASLQPELAHEPATALSGGADGLAAYRAIAALLPRLLASNGCAILEIGMGQGAAVSVILDAAGLEIAGFRPDLSGTSRCVTARMVRPAP